MADCSWTDGRLLAGSLLAYLIALGLAAFVPIAGVISLVGIASQDYKHNCIACTSDCSGMDWPVRPFFVGCSADCTTRFFWGDCMAGLSMPLRCLRMGA